MRKKVKYIKTLMEILVVGELERVSKKAWTMAEETGIDIRNRVLQKKSLLKPARILKKIIIRDMRRGQCKRILAFGYGRLF